MGDAVMDERGRIVVSNDVRIGLTLRREQKLRVSTRGREFVLPPGLEVRRGQYHIGSISFLV
jgi:hypothetical protein